jgi:UDP-3-O-[3-hydroxymyristoyl] glucosamine N-acyltransferase
MEVSLAEIARIVDGEIKGDANKVVCGVAPFDHAAEDEITFAGSAKFLKKIDETNAGAVIVPRSFKGDLPKDSIHLVVVNNPQVAFARILEIFRPSLKPEKGISSSAYIGQYFKCGKEVSIAPLVVIGENVTVGDRAVLHPHVVIGDNVVVGSDVEIYPNVTILDRCRLGSRITIHAGSVIGSDGFGFAPDGEGYYKIPQTGIVQIDDDVEIGAGNTIDRATLGKTWIKKGVKTDNLVHIAHNVTVGENTVIVAQVGIAGSTTIGRHVVLAGQAGISGHLTIGDHVTIGPKAGILQSVPNGEVVSGIPQMPHKLWLRVHSILARLPEFKKKILEMEKRLVKIEEKKNGKNS